SQPTSTFSFLHLQRVRNPELAVDALRHAYLKALTTSGSVVEAIDGKLVRTYANGTRETLKELSERPTPSRIGARMVRKQTV
ncbi:MAG TPA: hypothetical protein PKY05_10800, partial [Fibrobacteria bacterium]|nr:hypothetical protein [Fibrobacteria bacterium]